MTCYRPAGALYLFPRLDPEVYPIADVRKVFIDDATPAQLDLLTELGDQVRARLAQLEHRTR